MNPDQTNKAPLPLIILSWLVLLSGVLGVLGGGTAALLTGFSGMGLMAALGVFVVMVSAANIVLSFGLRKMKKWAFNWYMSLNVLTLLVSLIDFKSNIIQIIMTLVVVIYIWSIRQKFS